MTVIMTVLGCLRWRTTRKNIFDVGSNIGQSAFNMLHAPDVENVVLIDPSPLALPNAADTLIRNQMGHRIRFVNAFVSDISGQTVHFTGGYGAGGHLVDKSSNGGKNVTIPTMTVDSIVERLDISPDFVKFDVQGFEGKVLIGSTALASERQTRFLIEMHETSDRPQEKTTQEVLDWCDANSYAAWYLSEGIKITSTERVKQRGRYHLLLQPEEWKFPEWLAKIPQKAPVEEALVAIGLSQPAPSK